jgi:WD40 repeat protein
VAFNPNGKSLVSGSWDGTIVLWDIATRQPLTPNINTGGGGQVESVAFTPDGKTLASGGGGGVVFCDGATGEPRSDALATDTRGVKAVAFSPDGQILASGGGSNKVVLWNVEKRQQIGPSLTGHTRWVSSVSFSSNKRMLASAGGDNTIILWDIAAPHRLGQSLQGNSGPVESLAFTPDGMTLISCAQLTARTGEEKNQNEIRFWDAATGQERGVPLKCTTGRVSEIAVDPSGKTLAVASRPESPGGGTFSKEIEICLYDVSSRQPRRLPFSIQTDGVYCIAFSPDGKTLVSGGTAKESDDSGEIDFWEVNTGRPLSAPVIGHKRFVSGLEFSPDGKSMASSSLDDTILWDVATHHQRGQPFPGSATAFNPEGKMLAIYVHNYSTGENSIAFRDVETGRLNGQPITGITDVILSMAFSADGRTLVSLGVSDAETRTISLWDVASRRRLGLPFTPQSGVLEKVIFSPNGKMLASGSADGATILWDINFESWLVRAGGIANRNLSTVEWNQYLGPDSRYHRTFPNLPSNEDAPGR